MEIIYIDQLPSSADLSPVGATVGFFDGVHIGHRYLLTQLQSAAHKAHLQTVAITFSEHPRKVLQQDYQPKLLNSRSERLQLLATTGIDYCYVLDFTRKFADTTAQDFIQKILRKQLNVRQLLIGYDHKFGKNRTGSFQTYVEYGAACGMEVVCAEQLPETQRHTSSTAIRHLLAEGKVKQAAQQLSYPYTLGGTVIHGNHLGRTIGFPTANLDLDCKDKIIPLEGVYVARIHLDDETFFGMAYIGKRPTIGALNEQRIEVNIFDFDRDIYGKYITVEWLDFVRPDVHFDSIEALKQQLTADKTFVSRQSLNFTL